MKPMNEPEARPMTPLAISALELRCELRDLEEGANNVLVPVTHLEFVLDGLADLIALRAALYEAAKCDVIAENFGTKPDSEETYASVEFVWFGDGAKAGTRLFGNAFRALMRDAVAEEDAAK